MVKGQELIEQIVSNLDKLERIPDIFLKGGLAYAGFRATGHWTGAVTALVGLKLATGNNLAGGVAGVTALTLIGIGNAFQNIQNQDKRPVPASGEPQMYPWQYP